MHDYDAIIACVSDDKVAHVVDGDALRAHELAVPISLAAKDAGSGAIRMNHEYVVHVEVGNDDVSLIVERNSSRRIEVATQIAFVAKLSQQYPVVVEDQESVVAGVCHGDSSV